MSKPKIPPMRPANPELIKFWKEAAELNRLFDDALQQLEEIKHLVDESAVTGRLIQ